MQSFTSAIEDIEADEAREAKVRALIEQGRTREQAEREVEDGKPPVEFDLDGHEYHSYRPNEGQMAFMLANMGRGQSNQDRFAAIINVMAGTLLGDDKDHFEGRLLDGNPKTRLRLSVMEDVFAYLVEQWFRTDVSGSSTPALSGGSSVG